MRRREQLRKLQEINERIEESLRAGYRADPLVCYAALCDFPLDFGPRRIAEEIAIELFMREMHPKWDERMHEIKGSHS